MCDSCECTLVQGKGRARAAEANGIGTQLPLSVRPLHVWRGTDDVQQGAIGHRSPYRWLDLRMSKAKSKMPVREVG